MKPSSSKFTPEERILNARAAVEAQARGVAYVHTARRLGVTPSMMSKDVARYRETLACGGDLLEAFQPKHKNSGRPPKVKLSPEEIEALHKRMKMPAMTKAAAIRDLARDPCCSKEVREHIQDCVATGRAFSSALTKACNVTFQAQEKAKGPKHAMYAKESRIRNGNHILPDTGREVPIEPGDWWEFDDMSEDHPFWFEVAPDSHSRAGRAEKALRKHNALLGRQGLYAMDIKGKWLGMDAIGRANDAYTAADVLRFMRNLMRVYGKPRYGVRLEQAIWKSNVIAGNFALNDEERTKLKMGLNAIGLQVEYCYFSGQKGGIEGGFNIIQRMASLAFQEKGWPDVGRHAGEREAVEKKIRQAHQGVKHPQELGFPHIHEFTAGMAEVMKLRNREWHDGRIQQGVPDMNWLDSMEQSPLQPLTEAEERIFMPYVSPELTVRQEVVTHTIDGEEYRFNCTPLLEMGLGKGAKVRLQFDPTEPSRGAVVHNATPNALCPVGVRPGDLLGWVKEQEVTAQFGEQYRKGPRVRKFKAFQSSFVTPKTPGQTQTSIHEARDGRGNVARVERDQADAAPRDFRESEPAPAPVSERRNLAAEAAEATEVRKRERQESRERQTVNTCKMVSRQVARLEEKQKQRNAYSEV